MESVIYDLASELYVDYPDPMPAFQYFGGDYGKGLLESALSAPAQTFQGRWLHRTIFEKAAALFRSIIKNHPLVDGNKRLALTSVGVFLNLNGYLLDVPTNQAVDFAVKVAATHGNFELTEITKWLRQYSVRI
ncbi:MAG: type II toxin-antitoxin system death-on-curing family toxin [Chloroflexi bacterium]|nr:type II toxin-antitoxin system death-on-curing family toxin [Chloroflexota bacterium]